MLQGHTSLGLKMWELVKFGPGVALNIRQLQLAGTQFEMLQLPVLAGRNLSKTLHLGLIQICNLSKLG